MNKNREEGFRKISLRQGLDAALSTICDFAYLLWGERIGVNAS